MLVVPGAPPLAKPMCRDGKAMRVIQLPRVCPDSGVVVVCDQFCPPSTVR